MIKFTFFAFTVLLLCALVLASLPPKHPTVEKNHVLDMHCHVAGIGAGGSGNFLSARMQESWKYRVYLKAFGVTKAEIKQQGDALIIQRVSQRLAKSTRVGSAVLLALDGAIDADGKLDRERTEVYIDNNFLAGEVAKYNNLYFGASVNPYRSDALIRLKKVKQQGAVLIKWLPAIQHIDPADEALISFYRKLIELDLPLLTHAGDEHSFVSADNSLGDPLKLRLPLTLGVTVIVAHAATSGKTAGEDNMQRLLPLFDEYPNLYTDISSLTQVNKMRFLPRLLKAGIDPSRLLYGTDFPLIKTGLTSPFFSLAHVAPWKIMPLFAVKNPWDQDILLKHAYGLPKASYTAAYDLLLSDNTGGKQ